MKSCIQEQMSLLISAVSASLHRLLIIIGAFLMPISGILLTVGISIFADTIVGIWKSKKLGIKITSRRLSQIISKMLLYEATVILFFMIDSFILSDIMSSLFTITFLLTKVVALTLVSIEIYSIDENIKEVKGTGLFDAFKTLVARTKDIKDETDKLK